MLQMSEQELFAILQGDTSYQQLLTLCQEAEEAYLGVMERLSPEDRYAVEQYIMLCEEMDHRKLTLVLDRIHKH